MGHFYAEIRGNRGEATRMGTKSSGIYGHIGGWNIGCKVYCEYNAEKDRDEVYVYATGGSSGYTSKLIAKLVEGVDF